MRSRLAHLLVAAVLVSAAPALATDRVAFLEAAPVLLAAASDPGVLQLIKIGEKYLFEERYSEAANIYKKALSVDPSSPDAQWGYAHSLVYLDRFSESMIVSSRLIKQAEAQPNVVSPRLLSMAYVTHASAQGLKANRGSLVQKMIYGPRVKANFEKAIEIDPSNYRAYYALGRYYVLAPNLIGGDPNRAFMPLRKAMELSPANFYLPHRWLVQALFEAHQRKDGLEELQRFERKYAENVHAIRAIAYVKTKFQIEAHDATVRASSESSTSP